MAQNMKSLDGHLDWDVVVNIEPEMSASEMQLVLCRVHAIAVRDPMLRGFAESLERSIRKLIEARIAAEHAASNASTRVATH